MCPCTRPPAHRPRAVTGRVVPSHSRRFRVAPPPMVLSRLAAAALVAAFVVAAPVVRTAHAQSTTPAPAAAAGTIDVVAMGADDAAPIAFALVRLLPATGSAPLRQGVTSAAGRHRFAEVP